MHRGSVGGDNSRKESNVMQHCLMRPWVTQMWHTTVFSASSTVSWLLFKSFIGGWLVISAHRRGSLLTLTAVGRGTSIGTRYTDEQTCSNMPLFELSNLKSFDTGHRRQCEDQTHIQTRSKHQREHKQIYNAGSYLLTVPLKTYKTRKDSSLIHTSAPWRAQRTFPLSCRTLEGQFTVLLELLRDINKEKLFWHILMSESRFGNLFFLMTAFYFIVYSVLNNFQFVH